MFELSDVVCNIPHHTESVDDLVGYQFGVAAADLGVMKIVVTLSIAYIRGKFGR